MKNRVKLISVILSIVILSGILVGCARTGTCEACGQHEELKKFVSDGIEYWYCDECYKLAKIFGPMD